MSNLVGTTIAGRYRVNSLLASGGMASVYLASDTVLERTVALKVIHPHLAKDRSFADKFRREAKTAAKLSHPNLVNVFDQGTEGEIIFLVMEYVPGITLRDAMRDFGALDAKRALEIIEPLTAGLAAAHSAGILHRDIKPENVFLSDDGHVKLGDFGLARAITQHTQTGSVVGTVAYLSPELVLRGMADARSDIYSLGVMMFEMLTGRQPFDGEQAVQIAYQHANSRVPSPSTISPQVPELLDEIVLWATAREPNHRPGSAQALLPVISRARREIERGATMNLETLAKTMRIDLTAPLDAPIPLTAHPTEVFNFQEGNGTDSGTEDSPLAQKLRRGNRRAGIFLVFLTVFALLGASGIGWWFGSGPGGMAAIPDLENRELASAEQTLEGLGFETKTDEDFSASVAPGLVARTDPPAGSRAFKGTTITIFVSKGPKQIAVPSFEGLSIESYKSLLESVGLAIGEVEYFYDPAQIDSIYSAEPKVGEVVNQDTSIDIRVSAGPLPDLSGKTQAEAIAILQSLAIEVSEVIEVFDNQVPKGQVVEMVLASDPLPKEGSVKLRISKGPEIVTVPNVVGETIAAAKRLLESLNLKVIIDTNQLSSNFGIATVKKQTPRAYTQVRVGDTVKIVSR